MDKPNNKVPSAQATRRPRDTEHEGYDEKNIKYVVTNPDKDTRLEKTDLVFVLARSDPGDPELWDDFDNKNQDVYQIMLNKNLSGKKGKNQVAGEGKPNADGTSLRNAAGSGGNANYGNMANKGNAV